MEDSAVRERLGALRRGCVVVSPRGFEAPVGLRDVLKGRGFEIREVGSAAEVMVVLGGGRSEVGSVVVVEPGVLSDAKRLGESIKRYYPGVCVWRYAEGESPELGWLEGARPAGRVEVEVVVEIDGAESAVGECEGGGMDGISELVGGVVDVEVEGGGPDKPEKGELSDSVVEGVTGGKDSKKEVVESNEMFDSEDSAAILTDEELEMLLEDDDPIA